MPDRNEVEGRDRVSTSMWRAIVRAVRTGRLLEAGVLLWAAGCALTVLVVTRLVLLVWTLPVELFNLTISHTWRLRRLGRAALRLRWDGLARRCGEGLLRHAEQAKTSWDRGDLLHQGHLILGLVALREGDVEEARRRLLSSADVDGSAVLGSFGPNMSLARELLDRGEREAVLAYLERCGRFWPEPEKLERWSATIRRGEVPSFGANLIY